MSRALTAGAALWLAGCAALGPPPDAAEVIRRAEAALGSSDMDTLAFRGRGLSAAIGQAQSPDEHWPLRSVRSFSRAMNFDERAYREDFIRGPSTRADEQDELDADAPALNGPQPGETRGVVLARQAFSWDVVGVAVAPSQTSWQSRMHDLWLSTPQGALKAAARHGARAGRRFEGLRRLDTLSFEVPGQFGATLLLEADGRVVRIESVLPEPLLGDVAVRTEFSDYQPRAGLNFPHRIRQHHDDVLVLDVHVRGVELNQALQITVPENVRTSGNAPAVEFLSNGVWLQAGGTHHSVLVEQASQLVLVEAPLDDERGRALLGSAERLVDDKPVGTVVATHHHLDQIGGLRVLAGAGATVLISRRAQPWLQSVLQRPLARRPDPLSALDQPPKVEGVSAMRLLDDPQRPVEVHAVRDSPHADGMLMVWLPRERLLIHAEADANGTPGAAAATLAKATAEAPRSAMSNLLDNLDRLGIAPLHMVSLYSGRQPATEVYRALGRRPPR
jgi:glyoxylase-like metal-dependent hydrolase (beta-lactamase superfamily II)